MPLECAGSYATCDCRCGRCWLVCQRSGDPFARTMLSLTLWADHRIVDGATAAEFLRTLKGLLEEPGMMLA